MRLPGLNLPKNFSGAGKTAQARWFIKGVMFQRAPLPKIIVSETISIQGAVATVGLRNFGLLVHAKKTIELNFDGFFFPSLGLCFVP